MRTGDVIKKPSGTFFDFVNVMELPEKAALAWITSSVPAFRSIDKSTAIVVKANNGEQAVAIFRNEAGVYSIIQTHYALR